jgi:hypothetical protein
VFADLKGMGITGADKFGLIVDRHFLNYLFALKNEYLIKAGWGFSIIFNI